MTKRKLLFAAVLSAAAGCEPASPLTTSRGPCCGNIGQRGEGDVVVVAREPPAPQPALAAPVVEPAPAPVPAKVTKRRVRPRPRVVPQPLTRAAPAEVQAVSTAASAPAHPLLTAAERPVCGNVLLKRGVMRECTDAQGNVTTVRLDAIENPP